MRNAIALILSGGGGEKLSVLCSERAVSALPYGGKYRVIDFALSNCSHSEIEHVGVLAQHAPASLNDHIGAGRPWDLDRRTSGVVILQPYTTRSHAGWYRGTADAIAQNWDFIEDHRVDRVLILSGDHVYRMDYGSLFLAHEQRGASVTLAVTRVPADQTRRFGMVTTDRGGRVRTLEEKPERSSAPHASMGVYIFETEVLRDMLRGRPVDLTLDVLRPMIEAGERVYAHEFDGFWEDIGTVASYYRANLELIAPEPRLSLHDPRWPILTRDEERPPVLLRDGAVIEDSLIANGCRIAGTVRRSILFPGVTVAEDAVIVDSVVMSDVNLERGARIDRAILDKYVLVGEGACVGLGEDPGPAELSWLSGLVIVGKDSLIPNGAQIARPSVVGVGAHPEDFPDNALAPGTLMPNRRWYEAMT